MSLNNFSIVLASGSPRRQELLKSLNFTFSILKPDFNEDFHSSLNPIEIPSFLAENKIKQILNKEKNTLYITADTLVIVENKVLGKPKSEEDAFEMISNLSGKTHKVVTGVSMYWNEKIDTFQETTLVTFHELAPTDIDFYIKQYLPFDKAGAYGIQEWIGMIGIKSIEGSYYNVMGLPVDILYKKIRGVISTPL